MKQNILLPVLSREDIPNDDALIDELISLVDFACPQLGHGLFSELPAKTQAISKKAWRIASAAVFYGLLFLLIVGAVFISQGEKIPVLGYSFMNVLTWSMEPDIPQGSLVIIRETDPNAIQVGDDITFMKNPDTSVTHRVIGIREEYNGSGERGFETQGIANDTPDFEIVPAVNVAGVVMYHVPRLGSWLAWLRGNLLITGGFAAGAVLLYVLLKAALKKPGEKKQDKPLSKIVSVFV